jgi:hypothetical protein
MTPAEYIAIATAVVQLIKMLNEGKPVSTDLTPLTDAEKQAIDAKTAEVNAAVAAWDATQ